MKHNSTCGKRQSSSLTCKGNALTLTSLVVFLQLTGCVTANFTKPIASFQQSVNTSSAAMGEYYVNVNEFERQVYLHDSALNPEKEVFWQIANKPTPLAGQYFSAEAIRARMASLTLLATFGQRLTDLAGSDAPKAFSDNAKLLGQSLNELEGTFQTLAKRGDSSAQAYTGPIATLVGFIDEKYLEYQRDQWIREALTKGVPQVHAILDLLEKDLVGRIKPLLETGSLEILADSVSYYNRTRKAIDVSQRKQLLDEIDVLAVRYETAIAFNPSGLIQSIRVAFDALVKYANNPKTPQNFGDLVSALEAFAQNAQEIAKQVELTRKAAKGVQP